MKFIKSLMFVLVLFSTAMSYADDLGTNVVIVFDDSGSMSGKKIREAKLAMIAVLSKLPENSQFGLLALNSGWVVELGKLNKQLAIAATNLIDVNGGTPLGSSVKIGFDALLSLREKQKYGTYRFLIITDGEASDRDLLDTNIKDIMTRGIRVDVIGVDMANDHSLAKMATNYRRASNSLELEHAISQVFAENANSDQAISDFELLNAIPPGMAPAILTALSEEQNRPVGRALTPKIDSNGNVQFNAQGNIEFEPPSTSLSFFAIVLIAFGVLVVAILILVIFENKRY